MKLRVNKQVRGLLLELDQVMQQFHSMTRVLANREIGDSEAIKVGADREHCRSEIARIAYRINKASRGEE